MSTSLFRAVLTSSLFTLAVLLHLVGEWSGNRLMSESVFETLRIVAAASWLTAVAIRCTEIVLARIDKSDREAVARTAQAEAERKARAAAEAVERKERQHADAMITQLGGSRTVRTRGPGILAPVD